MLPRFGSIVPVISQSLSSVGVSSIFSVRPMTRKGTQWKEYVERLTRICRQLSHEEIVYSAHPVLSDEFCGGGVSCVE